MTRVMGGWVVFCAATLGAYADMQCPPEDILKRVPVVEIGQPEPADRRYVLHIRAGTAIPVRMIVKGPLLF